jgi:hypothetical protein
MPRARRQARAATRIEPWTIPFHVAMWTVLSVGFIMVLVVVLMN